MKVSSVTPVILYDPPTRPHRRLPVARPVAKTNPWAYDTNLSEEDVNAVDERGP